MPDPDPDPETETGRPPRLIYLLTTAQRRLEAWIERDAKGMTAARIGLLLAVPTEGGVAMSALARLLDLGAPSLTGLVDRMTKSGLVRRVPDPEDGRSALVELTDEGRATRHEVILRAKDVNRQLCEGFTEEEIAVVGRWLQAVRNRYAP